MLPFIVNNTSSNYTEHKANSFFSSNNICHRKRENWRDFCQHFPRGQLSEVSGQKPCQLSRNSHLYYSWTTASHCHTPAVKSESSRPGSWLSWVINPADDFIWLRLKLVSKLTPPHTQRDTSCGIARVGIITLISNNRLMLLALGNDEICILVTHVQPI